MTQSILKLFGTDGIRGPYGYAPLVPSQLWAIGRGIAFWLESLNHGNSTIVIGKDTRASCDELKAYLIQGLSAGGLKILDLGGAPTPAVSFLVPRLDAALGLMISASHNPFEDNGIKVLNARGEKLSTYQEREIELYVQKALQEDIPSSPRLAGIESAHTALNLYEEFLARIAGDLSGARIVVDCAHGAFFEIAPRVLQRCGAQVIPLGVQPNGRNINANVGALYPQKTIEAVQAHQALIGLCFDGDGDRLVLADERGVHDGDQVLACLAAAMAPKGVVGTVMSNIALEQWLHQRNQDFVRVGVGDRAIAAKLRENQWNLGGEPSGHTIFYPMLPTGDGLLIGLLVIRHILDYGNPFPLFRPCPAVIHNLPIAHFDVLSHEGIQAYIRDRQNEMQAFGGRLVIRQSGTESVIRILAEGPCPQMLSDMIERIMHHFHHHMDCTKSHYRHA